MARMDDVKNGRRTAPPARPFGNPSDNETFDILIPEGAESGKIPAGDQYIGKLMTIVHAVAKSSGNPMWTCTFTITEGKYAGMDFTIYLTLQPNALWKVTETLTALGVKVVPGQALSLKAADLVNTLVRLKIADESRDGRTTSKLQSVLPHPDGAGMKAKSRGFVPGPSADEEDEENIEDTPPSNKRLSTVSLDDEDEEEFADEDPRSDDEEDEVPAPKAKRGRKPAPVEEDDEVPEPVRRRDPTLPSRKSRL